MTTDPFQISLSTIIEVSRILGSLLKDKTPFREEQDESLAMALAAKTSVPLLSPSHETDFAFGSVDFLVYEENGRQNFYPIEFNGTGTTGIVNISPYAIQAILDEFTRLPSLLNSTEDPLILLPFYDKKASNTLIYEKVMIAEALKMGLLENTGNGKIKLLSEIPENIAFKPEGPTVIIGDLRELVRLVELRKDGRLTLFGNPVSASLHDIFCQNLQDKFEAPFQQFLPVNRIFPICADKGVAYQFMNAFLQKHPQRDMTESIGYQVAHNKQELIEKLQEQMRSSQQVLIKPHGAGIGNGIQFFVKGESRNSILEKVNRSIEQTEGFYGVKDGIYPYTICDFIDAKVISQTDHGYRNHKFELRFIVYKHQGMIKAFPSALKIAGQPYDKSKMDDLMLLMNATAISDTGHSSSVLPLCNEGAMAATGLNAQDFESMCSFSTRFVQYVLDCHSQNPDCFSPHQAVTPLKQKV